MSIFQTPLFTISGTTPSAQSSGTVVGSPVLGIDRWQTMQTHALLQGATGGTLDVSLQCSFDGTTWFEVARYPQLAAGAAQVRYINIGYVSSTLLAVTGTGTTQAMTANTFIAMPFGDRVRCLVSSGAGTSAGAPILFNFFPSTTEYLYK